jgi:hypothetical protein
MNTQKYIGNLDRRDHMGQSDVITEVTWCHQLSEVQDMCHFVTWCHQLSEVQDMCHLCSSFKAKPKFSTERQHVLRNRKKVFPETSSTMLTCTPCKTPQPKYQERSCLKRDQPPKFRTNLNIPVSTFLELKGLNKRLNFKHLPNSRS